MAPKKKDDKKKSGPAVDERGPLEAKAFIKAFPLECAQRNVSVLPLTLDRGDDGQGPFLRLAIHAGMAPSFDPQHARALLSALQYYSYLQRLCFWSVPLRDDGCSSLGHYLATNRTVHTLEVTDCAVASRGCKSLGDALERNSCLLTLRLDHNATVGSAGARFIGDGLRLNKGLQTLSLTFCGLDGEEGAASIVTGIMQAPVLKVLELKGNRLGSSGMLDLLRCFRSCTSIFRIDLADTGFGADPAVHAAFEECFSLNRSCCEYALGGNEVGDTCVYRWLGMVRRLSHLIYMDVTNNIDPMLFKQIHDAAAVNRKEWLKQQKKKGGKKVKHGHLLPLT